MQKRELECTIQTSHFETVSFANLIDTFVASNTFVFDNEALSNLLEFWITLCARQIRPVILQISQESCTEDRIDTILKCSSLQTAIIDLPDPFPELASIKHDASELPFRIPEKDFPAETAKHFYGERFRKRKGIEAGRGNKQWSLEWE